MRKKGARRRTKKTKKRIILGSGKCVHWEYGVWDRHKRTRGIMISIAKVLAVFWHG